MSIQFKISDLFDISAEMLFNVWLDSAKHSAMTGGKARVSDIVGESFTTWDGYICGTNIELKPERRILQRWRTNEFSVDEPDSLSRSQSRLNGIVPV